MIRAQIIIDLDIVADAVTPDIRNALDALADVMITQAEEGLYLSGSPDDTEANVDGQWVDNVKVADIKQCRATSAEA